jgi:hypothetical protein
MSALAGAAAVGMMATIAYVGCSRGSSSSQGLVPPGLVPEGLSSVLSGILAPPVQPPRVIVDEDISIAAHTWESRSFTLPSAHPVQIVAEGKTHAEKGFTVHAMPTSDLEHFRKDQAFQPLPAFEGIKVHSFTRADAFPIGSWTVVVKNSENVHNPMVVHLRIVLDPT